MNTRIETEGRTRASSLVARCAWPVLFAGALHAQEPLARVHTSSFGRDVTFELELVEPGTPAQVAVRETVLASGAERVRWSGPSWTLAWSPDLAFASTGERSWLVGTQLEGATRALDLWSWTNGATGSEPVRRTVHAVAVQREAERLELFDVFAPQLLEWHGEAFVVAAGWAGSTTPAREVVWLAPLAEWSPAAVREGTWARFLAEGTDPRTARSGTEVWVAVRATASERDRAGLAPLEFHRSGGPSVWARDATLSGTVHVSSGYALDVDREGLFVATPVPGDDQPELVVWRFDETTAAWRRTGTGADGTLLRSTTDRVRTSTSGFRTEISFVAPDGAWTRTVL